MLAVELCEHGVVVHVHHAINPAGAGDLDEGSGCATVQQVPFAPAVPPSAARLWLASARGDIRGDLR